MVPIHMVPIHMAPIHMVPLHVVPIHMVPIHKVPLALAWHKPSHTLALAWPMPYALIPHFGAWPTNSLQEIDADLVVLP